MRLFIAINFPPAMRTRLWDALGRVRGARYPVRWVRPENLHLTVKFLGDVSGDRVDAVARGLTDAVGDTRRFRLPVTGFGVFPNAKRPRVVWVGCEGLPVLELLQDAVERAMDELGFPVEGRPFRPHVTIGRVKRDAAAGTLSGLVDDLEVVEFLEEPEIDSVDLMQSELGRPGPRYEVLHAVELRG